MGKVIQMRPRALKRKRGAYRNEADRAFWREVYGVAFGAAFGFTAVITVFWLLDNLDKIIRW